MLKLICIFIAVYYFPPPPFSLVSVMLVCFVFVCVDHCIIKYYKKWCD
jgi:hypothetical protein